MYLLLAEVLGRRFDLNGIWIANQVDQSEIGSLVCSPRISKTGQQVS